MNTFSVIKTISKMDPPEKSWIDNSNHPKPLQSGNFCRFCRKPFHPISKCYLFPLFEDKSNPTDLEIHNIKWKVLSYYARKRDYQQVKNLLGNGLEYNQDAMGAAIANGDLKMMKLLHSKASSRNIQTSYNKMMYIGITNGQIKAMELYNLLIKDYRYKYDHEWLYVEAVKLGQMNIFLLLIEWDKRNILKLQVSDLFRLAAEHGQMDIMRFLVNMMKKFGKKIYYDVAMRIAIENNQVEAIKLIESLKLSE